MVFATPANRATMGKSAIGYGAKVALIALAQNFAMGFEDPVGGPIFRFGLVRASLATFTPLPLPFNVLGGAKGVPRGRLGGEGVGV